MTNVSFLHWSELHIYMYLCVCVCVCVCVCTLTFSQGLLRMVDNSWGLIIPHMYPLAFSSMGTSYPATVALVLATAAAMATNLDHKNKVWLPSGPQRLCWQLFHIVVNSLLQEGASPCYELVVGNQWVSILRRHLTVRLLESVFVCRSWCQLFLPLLPTLRSETKENAR